MADAKTKIVGTMPASSTAAIPGWKEYDATAKALSDARKKSEAAKDKIRATLLSKLEGKTLDNGVKVSADNLDFTVDPDGSVRIFVNLQEAKGRRKSDDLSDLFEKPVRAVKA